MATRKKKSPARKTVTKKKDKLAAVCVALLDENCVLTGFEMVPEAKARLGPRRIEVPPGCDLRPGCYRHRDGAFWPLPPKRSEDELRGTPDAIRAIARGFMAIRDDGRITLPPDTLAWLDFFEKSFDNKG